MKTQVGQDSSPAEGFQPDLPLLTAHLQGVVIRHKDELDWQYLEDQLRPLVEIKEEPEIFRTVARLRLL
jgi:hypothetical protein